MNSNSIGLSEIFISDLDGILLRNNGTISKYSIVNLKFLLKNKVKFTVASARSIKSIQKILKGIPIRLPIIEFNGAFISDFKTGKHEIINEIDKDVVLDVLEIIQKNDKIPLISSYNGKDDCLYYNKIVNEGMKWKSAVLLNRFALYRSR